MILTENVSPGDGGADLPGDLPIPPEMIPAILRRVNAAAGKGNRQEAGPESVPDTMSPEIIRRVLARLGDALHRLPVAQKSAVIQSLDAGVVDAAAGADGDGGLVDADFVRTLTGADSDDEFLDLLATLLVAEKKSGNRIRKISRSSRRKETGMARSFPLSRGGSARASARRTTTPGRHGKPSSGYCCGDPKRLTSDRTTPVSWRGCRSSSRRRTRRPREARRPTPR